MNQDTYVQFGGHEMMFFTGRTEDWQKRFAFLPTAVGVSADGRMVYVWLMLYERRWARLSTLDNMRRMISAPLGVRPVLFYCNHFGEGGGGRLASRPVESSDYETSTSQ